MTFELSRINLKEFRRILPYMPDIEGWIGAEAHYIDSVSYTHLDVYKRQVYPQTERNGKTQGVASQNGIIGRIRQSSLHPVSYTHLDVYKRQLQTICW